jgi:hypothetical protein
MVYLVKGNANNVRIFYSEAEMKTAGFPKAGKTVTEEEFNSNGCYARVIDGKIVVGKTDEEKAEAEKQEQIAEHMAKLEQIDVEAGASRHVRDVSVSAGVVLDAVRILLSKFAKELNVNLPSGFGSGVASAEDILNLAPAANATDKEKADFAVYKALLLVSHYDPAINPGLTKIREAEMRAIPIRLQLAELV